MSDYILYDDEPESIIEVSYYKHSNSVTLVGKDHAWTPIQGEFENIMNLTESQGKDLYHILKEIYGD